MFYKRNSEKGFTLIELLVVIAIIGILSSVVLASLNDARRKSRDARRVSDIKQLQLALEFYFDANRTYPFQLDDGADSLATEGYMAQIPTDPTTQVAYFYAAINPTTGGNCTSYHIGALLEDSNHVTLTSDQDASGGTTGTNCLGAIDGPSAADFDGDSADCAGGGVADQCYDVIP